MTHLDFELVRTGGRRAELGESPVWDSRNGDLWWVDVSGKKLFRMEGGSRDVRHWDTPEQTGFVALTSANQPAVGMETGVFLFDPRNGSFERIVALDGEGQRFNDATVDPLGRLWTSTMALDAQPGRAAIQLVTGDLALQTVVEGLAIPNGLAVDTARGRFYYSDSHAAVQTIWVAPIRSGLPVTGEANVFARTETLDGRPDGAALDERGFYWIAGVDGSALYVFDPQGQLHDTLAVPFPAPTKVSFFGADGRSIAVTSKQIGENGGFLALAKLPEGWSPGIGQPFWSLRP